MLSFVPALVNTFTITYYLRSLVLQLLELELPPELPQEVARIIGGASLQTSLLTLGGMILFGLGASSLLASRREYVVADAAS